MSSQCSDDYKSSSMTSDSDRSQFEKKIKEFKYPPMPKRNPELRKINQYEKLDR